MQLMRNIGILLLIVSILAVAANKVPPAPNGIKFQSGYQDWTVLSMSH